MIEFKNPKISVRRQCTLLGLARATAYHKSPEKVPSKEEIQIKNAMDEIQSLPQ